MGLISVSIWQSAINLGTVRGGVKKSAAEAAAALINALKEIVMFLERVPREGLVFYSVYKTVGF